MADEEAIDPQVGLSVDQPPPSKGKKARKHTAHDKNGGKAEAADTADPRLDDSSDPAAPEDDRAKKAYKQAKAKKADKAPPADEGDGKPLGTAKAVETMFRNAVRAELEIIALAATKANIMISLNGFIISALMISGAFLFNSSPGFLIPAGVFLLTSAASIVFALLAASPERADFLTSLWAWLRDVVRGRASLLDLRRYVMEATAPDPGYEANVLIYEDRVRFSREDFWERMQMLLRDRDDVYRKMSDQLYWLGKMADHKFKLLNVSYTVFRWGLLASVLTFFVVKSTYALFPQLSGEPVVRLRNLGIAEFNDIYEPSAVQQLADGRILVVEDEAKRAFSLMSIGNDGALVEDSTADLRLIRAFGRPLNDLEGLSVDDEDNIYAITSHSLNAKGERVPDREQLLRFKIRGNSVGYIFSYTNLRDALMNAQGLKDAVQAATGEELDFEKLNIEGLAYVRSTKQLMLGLREPMAGDHSVIVTIQNPAEVFAGLSEPRFADPIILDLQGGGIRALSFDPVLQTFLIVNEIESAEGNKYSQLWSWNGRPDAPAQPIALPDIINLNNVESIDSILVHDEPRLLIMSDEGNEKKNRPARYMMLDYDQLPQMED